MVTFLTPLTICFIIKVKGSIGHAFTVCIRTENQNQRSFYPFILHEISVLIELLLGHLCYRLTDVPPQPNSPPDYVSRIDLKILFENKILINSRNKYLIFQDMILINEISKLTSGVVVFHRRYCYLPLILHLLSQFTKSD